MTNTAFFDSHAHLNLIVKKDFDRLLNIDELNQALVLLDEMELQNLKVVNIGTSLTESINCLEIAKLKPKIAKAALGIHPNDITENWQDDLAKIEAIIIENINNNLLDNNLIVAIGECGYDKHYPNYDLKKQEACFKAQIELALKYNKALIVHTRDAKTETLNTLSEYKDKLKKVVIHCFSEDEDFAKLIVSWGFMMGIGGTITYPKNNYLRDIVKKFGLKNIILETDAPYLAPQEQRGKINSSLNIPIIAKFIADLLNLSLEEVAKVTTENCQKIFDLKN